MKRVIAMLLLVVESSLSCAAAEKEPANGYFLVTRAYVSRDATRVATVSYFPSSELCCQALLIYNEETFGYGQQRSAECRPIKSRQVNDKRK